MRQTFLESAEDMAWLTEQYPEAAGHVCAILHGNEDSPRRVELYRRNHYQCVPTVLEPDSDGNMVLIQHGEA